MASGYGTNLGAQQDNSTVQIDLVDINGNANLAHCTGTPVATANWFNHGCLMIQTDGGSGANSQFVNTGTLALPVWTPTTTDTHTPTVANATATLTAAQVATGYITSTSAAATTLTLPTGTLLGAAIGAVQGTVLDLYIDNTAGANTVTLAVATNGIKSDAANTTAASFGQLTVASGVTGIGRFTIMFSSATAYVFTRTA